MSKSPVLSAGSGDRHPTEAAQTVTQDQAEDLVHLIAARAGLAESPQLEWVAGISGRVRLTRKGIRLSLGREILADEEDARFTIAHELGHIVRGHCDRRTARRTFAWLAGTAGAVFLSLIAAGLTLRGVRGLALVGFGPLLVILIHRPLIRRIVQPQELEADDFAAQQQCPLTVRLAERYQESDRKEARLLSWAYPTHPSWATRGSP
jgi:Zn-dependent protease with chaperone function